MKLSDIIKNNSIDNREKFGLYLQHCREERDQSIRDLAKMLDVTPTYISDIEKGNRHAPKNHIDKLIDIFNINDEDIDLFYDLAGCSRSNWPELNEYLAKNPNARKAIRLARDNNISGEELLEFINKEASLCEDKETENQPQI